MAEAFSRQESQELLIWAAEGVPASLESQIYCWNGYAEKDSVHSLLRYVDTHGDRLRRKYLTWIHKLGESQIAGKRLIDHLALKDGLSYWWMTLFVEKSLGKSPSISVAIRLLALEEIVVQQKPGKLRLVSANRQLHEVLRDLCRRLGIDYKWEKTPDAQQRPMSMRIVYKALPISLQALINLARHVWGRWALKNAERTGWFGGDQSMFFCSYFDNVDPKEAEQGQFHSYYWAELQPLLKRIGVVGNWLQLFVPCALVPTPHSAMKWLQGFNRNVQENGFSVFLDTYLSWRIILRVLKQWLWLNIVVWRLRDIKYAFRMQESQLSLWPIMRGDWTNSMRGLAAVDNLLWLELFDAAMREVPCQKKGLYLCENQAWERAFIHAWRKHGHGQLIAVAHTTVRFWDLRYFTDPCTLWSAKSHPMPQPDLVALNGNIAVEAYRDVSYPKEAIFECEALRYGYLNGLKGDRRSKREPDQRRKVLVLGDVMASATTKLLKLLEASIAYGSDGMTFVVKPHPNCPVRTEDFPLLRFEIVTDQLGRILQDYDVAYSSNGTSAAVDAYLFGLPVVVMLDETELNVSPLRGQLGAFFVSSPEELAEALQPSHQNPSFNHGHNEFFFLDPKLPRWSHLLAS